MEQIWTFNLVYTYADWSFCSTYNVFPFYGLSYSMTYDMTPLREAKDPLRARFAEDSYRVNRLTGVDWRVDSVLACGGWGGGGSGGDRGGGGGMGGGDGGGGGGGGGGSEAQSESAGVGVGPLVHVRVGLDTRPHEGVSAETGTGGAGAGVGVGTGVGGVGVGVGGGGRYADVAFELSPEKLAVLVLELSKARQLMQSVNN
jgi:hypothetical protein